MHAGPSSAASLRHAGHGAEYEPEAAREPAKFLLKLRAFELCPAALQQKLKRAV